MLKLQTKIPMLQEASTHLLVPEPSEDLITSEPWSMDTYADGLMDELFADIDDVLDGRGKPYSQTVKAELSRGNKHRTEFPPEYAHLQTVSVPQIVLPQTPGTVESLPQTKNKQPLSRVVVNNPTVRKVVKKPKNKSGYGLGKVLTVGVTLGVAIAGVMHMFNSGLLNRLSSKLTQQALQAPQNIAEQVAQSRVDIQGDLVEYMLGALSVIDKQEAKNSQTSVKPVLTAAVSPAVANLAPAIQAPGANLPPPLAANNIPPAAGRTTTVVERIYIPVYQAPQPMRYAPPAMAGIASALPQVPSAPSSKAPSMKTAINTVRQAAKPMAVNIIANAVRTELKPVAVRTAPITLGQAPKPPALPIMSFRAIPPKLPVAKAPTRQREVEPDIAPEPRPATPRREAIAPPPPPSSVAAAPAHTLEGVMEKGDQSAALFKIDGATRRVSIGEGIGSSGWTLVEISNGEAIIRRNGEVRSIYTGQKL
jgi:hypothetical protein